MKTKEKIVKSLITLMKHDEFDNIKIKDISDNAQINRSTFYRNFKTKEDVIKYKFDEIMNEYLNEFEQKEDKTKENYIYTILNTYYKHKDFIQTIYLANKLNIFQEVYIEYFKNKNKKIDKEELYKIYYHMGGIQYFTICWIEEGMNNNIEELTKIAIKITKNFNPILMN